MTALNQIGKAELEQRIDYSRQRGWYDPTKRNDSVTLVGCGGVGSPTGMMLGKLGIPNITLIDGDTVEKHNIPNQMFRLDQIGKPKVVALAAIIDSFAMPNITTHNGFLTKTGIVGVTDEDNVPGFKPRGLVVSGLDSMEARKEVWETIKYNLNVPLYLDMRLGGQNVVLYSVKPSDFEQCKAYEETLYSDEEAVEAPCTMRSVIDVGTASAMLLTRAVRMHFAGEPPNRLVFWNHRDLRITVPD